MKINIRRAKPEGIGTIQVLNKGLFASDGPRDRWLNHNWPYEKEGEDFFKKRITNPKYLCLVADIGWEIVGYLAGSMKGKESWRTIRRTELENMFVLEKYRNHGVGKLLIKEFIEWSKERKVKLAMVSAYASNAGSVGFYQREGFKPYSVSLEAEI